MASREVISAHRVGAAAQKVSYGIACVDDLTAEEALEALHAVMRQLRKKIRERQKDKT